MPFGIKLNFVVMLKNAETLQENVFLFFLLLLSRWQRTVFKSRLSP